MTYLIISSSALSSGGNLGLSVWQSKPDTLGSLIPLDFDWYQDIIVGDFLPDKCCFARGNTDQLYTDLPPQKKAPTHS